MPRLRKQETSPQPATATPGRPLFEIDPGFRLIAAIKQAFGGHFTPTDRAWWRFECELKEISRTNNPTGHDAFCQSYFTMTADDVIAFLVKHGMAEDLYQRIADAMSGNARKIVSFLFHYGATKQADATTRSEIGKQTRLSDPQVKSAIEVEIAKASALLGAAIIESKASFGTWLSAAGIEVAKRIDQKILK